MMTRQAGIVASMLVTGLVVAGYGLLTAEEPAIPRQQRVSPKVLKEALEHPVITATANAAHTPGRIIQDLRSIADDLDKAGQKSEAMRLRTAIREIVRRVEHDMAEKKGQASRLNAEIEELKWAISQ